MFTFINARAHAAVRHLDNRVFFCFFCFFYRVQYTFIFTKVYARVPCHVRYELHVQFVWSSASDVRRAPLSELRNRQFTTVHTKNFLRNVAVHSRHTNLFARDSVDKNKIGLRVMRSSRLTQRFAIGCCVFPHSAARETPHWDQQPLTWTRATNTYLEKKERLRKTVRKRNDPDVLRRWLVRADRPVPTIAPYRIELERDIFTTASRLYIFFQNKPAKTPSKINTPIRKSYKNRYSTIVSPRRINVGCSKWKPHKLLS